MRWVTGCSDMNLWFKRESILLSVAMINTITESNLGERGRYFGLQVADYHQGK